ncbi:MAG: hypothetical protein MJ236_07065 [Clostridia bacterium]|nr:hypothetical protein [Clostridia bacterium]
MKRIIALSLVVVMVAVLLCSCATTLSGEYTAAAGSTTIAGGSVTYKFSGSKVTMTTTAGALGFEKTTTVNGTYKIVDGERGQQITFTMKNDKGEETSSTVSFSQDKDAKTITIAGVTYKKK